MNQSTRSRVGLLLVCAVCCLAVVVAFSQQKSESVVDPDVYEDFMSAQVQDVYALETFFFDQQDTFLPMIPPDPDFTLRQTASQPLPFDLKSFPTEFAEGLVYEYENSVPVFPVTVLEDPFTHETVFLNAEGKELYALPPAAGYDPYSYLKWLMPDLYSGNYSTEEVYYWQRLYSPDRIQSVIRLIPTENVEPYLYVAAKIQEAQAALAASLGGGIGLLRSEYSESNINFEVIARTNGVRMVIGYPDDFTNRLDVYMCNDLMQYVWTFAVKELSTTGTNEITWVDTNYWVASGPPVRFYSAGNADLDTDGDGYADAREIMVFRTSETDSNSRPIRISGTVSYSGIETGTIWVLSTTVTDSWSIAQSVSLSGPGVYSNDIGNNQSYWFKAFRDVNSSYVRDAWEPWGVYSSSSTLITGDTSGLDITLQDQPSLWGAVDFSGAETGNVWVVAVTASDSWSTAYSSMLPWTQGGDPMTGGVAFLTFPASFSITQLPVSNYWIRAFIDQDYDGAYTEGEIAGQYTSNSIPVSNRITGLNFTLDQDADSDGLPDWWEWQHGTDVNNPDTDGDGFSDGDEVNVYSTDPLDKYSVPPLPMLTASGKYVVDSSSNRVVLKSVNIGGWLQWEQWMLQYEPVLWTNEWGKLYGTATNAADQLDEQTARELMINNVDLGVTLLAVSNNGASGVTTGTTWAAWLGDTGVKIIENVHNGDWLCFSNVNFGSGVSNLAIGLAVPTNDAGKQIKVRLGSPGGTEIGSLTTKATSHDLSGYDEWCALAEQCITLSTNLSGTQTVYFVGSAGSGAIANLYRFRFWRDENTKALFETFRDKYFTTNDLDTIKSLGYNCIRLAFFHSLVEDETAPYAYKTSGWSRLDWVLSECAKRRLWVILDLHSTPGGQNPYHASGIRDPFKNRMWLGEFFKDRTEKLWAAIASRYATNPVVAGYDLFNEPDPPRQGSAKSDYQTAFSNSILPMVTRVHKAIRSNDTAHILFLEGNMMYTNMWDDAHWWPVPASNGWTNVVYEFHVYDQTVYGRNYNDDWWFSTQKRVCDSMIRAFTRFSEARQTPVYVGEFAPWDERNTEYWLRQCEANDLHWGQWNYRSWGWDDPTTPTKGRTVWGLDYRSAPTTNQKPRLNLDALGTLSNKFAQYDSTNYTDNVHLQEVVQNHTFSTNPASERTEFYLNTFDCANVTNLSDWKGLPWRKLAAVGPENKFRVQTSRADLLLDGGPLLMRFKSRDEADARFEVSDSEGTTFSVDVAVFNAPGDVAGADAEVRLSAVRDEITSPVKAYDTEGVVARLAYDVASNSVTLYLDTKSGGTNTFGTELYQSAAMGFVANATLMLSVNQTNASIVYNGTNLWTGAHGLDLTAWPNGAVAAAEAERMSGSGVTNVVLDSFKAWRESARVGIGVTNMFTAYPDGITLLTEPEQLTIRECYAQSWKSESFVTNGEALWIPEESASGGSWFNPRVDYQNDVRLNTPVTNVVELRVAYSQFRSTNFYAKISFMPEFFPGELYWVSGATLPYIQVQYLDSGAHAGNLRFELLRHTGPGAEASLNVNDNYAFIPGQVISYELSTNMCHVYYGTNLLINYAHGVNITNTYPAGTFPHLEFQNKGASTNVTAWVGSIVCRELPTWTPPEP